MNIRSLTVGAALPLDRDARGALIERLGAFAVSGKAALEAAGFTVQSTRLSTQPLERWAVGEDPLSVVAEVGEWCKKAGFGYCSLGTIQGSEGVDDSVARLIDMLPEILLQVENCFGSLQVGMRQDGGGNVISLASVKAAARIIRALADGSADGFGNLRFAAASNCPPHVPFFPASYYMEDERNSGEPEFGLALEAADLAVRAFEGARSHEEARGNLLALIADEGGRAAESCGSVGANAGFAFTGLDISMAPFPTQDRSIGHALELVAGGPLGAPGTLAAAAFVTSVLRDARALVPTVGYSGLMLPALEDQTLADRAGEGLVTLDTLLLMSAVCGLGLDTIPLAGDISLKHLERIILDMAALAVRLDKPLTARLMPVPGKSAGDPAEWPDFPFFARGKVMSVPYAPGEGGLFGGELLVL